jgi:hypothetical protein
VSWWRPGWCRGSGRPLDPLKRHDAA